MVEVREKFRMLGTGKHFESRATCPGGHCYIETPLNRGGLKNRSCMHTVRNGSKQRYLPCLGSSLGGGCSLSRHASLSAGRQGSSHAQQGTQNARYVFLRCTLHPSEKGDSAVHCCYAPWPARPARQLDPASFTSFRELQRGSQMAC